MAMVNISGLLGWVGWWTSSGRHVDVAAPDDSGGPGDGGRVFEVACGVSDRGAVQAALGPPGELADRIVDTGAVTVATSGDPCREDCLDAQARQCFECVVGLGQVPVVGEGFSGGGHCKGSLNRWQGWSRCCLDEVC